MRTPRRWMALAAAIAILTLALLPGNAAALTGGIKLYTPPNDDYNGEPDIPDYITFAVGQTRLAVQLLRTPTGLVLVVKRVSALRGVPAAQSRSCNQGTAVR